MKENPLQRPVEFFKQNRDAVFQLAEFDKFVLDVAVQQLRTLRGRLEKAWDTALGEDHPEVNPRLSVDKTIQILDTIRQHRSLKTHYQVMINQCIVLLVSYFGSAVRDLFKAAVGQAIRRNASPKLMRHEFRARVRDLLRHGESIEEFVAEELASSSDFSVQDMKSIHRAFETFFNVRVPRDEVVNDIIMAQACRHTMVHSGFSVDTRLYEQVTSAQPRRLKPRIQVDEELAFTSEEVGLVAGAMTTYLERLAASVDGALSEESA